MEQRSNNRKRGREEESKKERKKERKKQQQQQKQTKKNKTTKISAYLVIHWVVSFSFLTSSSLKNNQGRNDDKKQADAHRGPHNFRQIN